MVWDNILDADVDPDSPLTTTLLTQIRDNLVALQNQPFSWPIGLDSQTPGAADTYERHTISPSYEMDQHVPQFGKKLVAALQMRTISGTATAEMRINGEAEISDEVVFTNTAFERKEFTFADLSAHRDAILSFEIWIKHSGPALITVQGEGPTSRWES